MGKEEPLVSGDKVARVKRGDVLVITIDNPPLGTLTSELRAALLEAVETARADAAIRSVVIAGTGSVFASGASTSEEENPDLPDLAAVCDQLEACHKPVVAAIAGSCLGGGLELALAAHLRVVHPAARLGSPEITVGLLPRAGGTQRLPKVVGGVAALKLLLSGRSISGETAQKVGLSDILAEAPLETAIAAARRLATSKGALRRSSQRRDRLGEGTAFLEAVAEHRRAAAQSPLEAPERMIECIEAALLLPYDIGRGLEQAAYEDLVDSEHSRSLRHIFAAERELQAATRWEGQVESRTVRKVAIVGARGTAAELAVLCLDAGFELTIAEDSDEALESGVARIIEHFDARVTAGKMPDDAVEAILDRMNAVSGFSSIVEADLVIDPLVNTDAARVGAIDRVMREGSVLALASEAAPLVDLAAATSRAADVVGLRFAFGPRRRRLVEFTAPEATTPKAVATARAILRKIDRLILDVGPSRHSVALQLTEALHAAADLCLEDGASVTQIDAALRDWGIPHGSFQMRDLQGIARFGAPEGIDGKRGAGLDASLIAAGRIGIAAARGYYIYRERGKPGVEDPEIAAMVEADRTAKGIQPRKIKDSEIRKRCLAAMAGVGADLLEAGVLRRAADCDMVAIHALGFARRTGGIMFAADLVGLEDIHKTLKEMSSTSSRIAEPNRIFYDLVGAGTTFSGLDQG